MKLFTIAILLSFTGVITGLKCYVCTYGSDQPSTDTSACLDPFDPSTTDPKVTEVDCGSGFDTCFKSVGTHGDHSLAIRSCFSSALCAVQDGCQSGSVEGGDLVACCCSGDLCNGAGAISATFIAAATVVILALALTA